MNPKIYNSYVSVLNKESTSLIPDALNTQESDTQTIVVKNYNKPNGLSYRFSQKDMIGLNYTVTGPIGKGLFESESLEGTYVAFGAGTGILTFMDLVASIARSCIETFNSPGEPHIPIF